MGKWKEPFMEALLCDPYIRLHLALVIHSLHNHVSQNLMFPMSWCCYSFQYIVVYNVYMAIIYFVYSPYIVYLVFSIEI